MSFAASAAVRGMQHSREDGVTAAACGAEIVIHTADRIHSITFFREFLAMKN